jgi:hypothetical protein
MSSETFLSRWSRRKQAVRTGEPREEAAAPEPDSSAATEAHEPAAPQYDPASMPLPEVELSADEIAALPPVAELTAESDITLFLCRGVPEPLRNAALRRMWALDPKIRDFVGDAREYAYDWNTPGGVPGSGPLPSREEIARMAARIVRGETPESSPLDEPVASTETHSQHREQLSAADPDATGRPATTPHENADLRAGETTPCGTTDRADASLQRTKILGSAETSEVGAETQSHPAGESVGSSARRHGGAMPL